MLISMTGFGRGEAVSPSLGRVVVEIQTLNHRFLDMEFRLPEGFLALEQALRARVAASIRRGRARIFVNVKSRKESAIAVFQQDVAKRYAVQLKQLQKKAGLSGAVTLETVLTLPHVVTMPSTADLSDQWAGAVGKAAAQALQRLAQMRRKEGGRLEKTLARLAGSLERLKDKTAQRVPEAQKNLEERIRGRLREEVPQADPEALLKEAAVFVRETDVSEELARLQSHLTALKQAISGKADSPGRTIDFLAQELQRETNTLGVKVKDAQINRWVVEMKGLIEKIREQAANIE
ncbi:MAG: YicC family protein [Candidatus Omnitrophica bacterium]|nr:YicC family protein [Candidatus Omnitrophota bacterium]